MPKQKVIDVNEPVTVFKPDRYLLLPAAAERIGLPLRTLHAWREKCRFDSRTEGLLAKVGKVVFFDLDAGARHLERIQLEATEAARAWENRFRLVVMFPAAAIAVAIATALLHGGGGF